MHRKEKPGQELSVVKKVEHSHIRQKVLCYTRI
nr:MAG TPA: hypothetical protein [Caudoviricetes sp.]DAY95487.1 MAG TPA: hypothetical protein [Caudoviricetes sp.]